MRIRLTQRARMAVDAENDLPYPGNVNRPERTDPVHGKYHTFVQQVNHELPDMRYEWQDNPRNEIGFGEPKEPSAELVASVRTAAAKAVKVAVLLLGERAPEDVIERQAHAFMRMGTKALDGTLKRFAKTEKLYTAEAEETPAAEETPKKADDLDIDLGETQDEVMADDEEAVPDDAPTDMEGDDSVIASIFGKGEDRIAADEETDEETDENEKTASKKTASKKQGIKSLGGQPRVASEPADEGLGDLSKVWDDGTPDISEI